LLFWALWKGLLGERKGHIHFRHIIKLLALTRTCSDAPI
jgi:hypothetical protein